MIVGIGTDIVEVTRIGEMIERHGEIFLQRVFTEGEICLLYTSPSPRDS